MAVILVVDDDPDIRELVALKLASLGHQVHQACNGLEGLTRCRELGPDLAIVDVNMPVMSGLDLVSRLRGEHLGHDLPIILVTALAQVGDVEAGLAAGATDYITKPFSPAALAARIDELLGTDRDLAG